MSHFKAEMHHIRFPASVCPSARLLDGVWHLFIPSATIRVKNAVPRGAESTPGKD